MKPLEDAYFSFSSLILLRSFNGRALMNYPMRLKKIIQIFAEVYYVVISAQILNMRFKLGLYHGIEID